MTPDAEPGPDSKATNKKIEDGLKTNLIIALLAIIVGLVWAWISVIPAEAPPFWTPIAVGFGVIWFVVTRIRMWRYKKQRNKVPQSTTSGDD